MLVSLLEARVRMGELVDQQKGARAHGEGSSRAVRRTRRGRLSPGAGTELWTARCRLPSAPTPAESAGSTHLVGVPRRHEHSGAPAVPRAVSARSPAAF